RALRADPPARGDRPGVRDDRRPPRREADGDARRPHVLLLLRGLPREVPGRARAVRRCRGADGGAAPARRPRSLSAEALGLALAAAGLHASWNLLIARERDTQATTAVSLVVFVAALVPLAVATWRVEAAAVPYILASGALELLYIALLAAAYRRFELSLVYPLARGLAPVLALVIVVVVVGASPSAGEIVGVVTVTAGILLVRGVGRSGRGTGLAVATAAAIAGYTVIDRHGIQHANAAPYLLLVMLGPAL